MSKQNEILNRRKGSIRQISSAIEESSNIGKIKNDIKRILEIVDQITGRAEVAENRIDELENFAPQAIDFECPSCSHEIQFSIPGSSWYREQIKIKNGQK